uniref:Uncharacterized protein n=1 Tax=Dromaius novaehollandiae TaxID=8790 RepID=A0A8C4K1D7_DRONO
MQPSRPDRRPLIVRLPENLALHNTKEFNSYNIDDNWMQILGLALHRDYTVSPRSEVCLVLADDVGCFAAAQEIS